MTEINYNDKIAYIERQKMLKLHRETVVTAFDLTRDERPEDTVAMLVKILGHKEAMIAIAECVNAVSYDGRIYDDVAVWAAGIEGAASSKELDDRHLYALSEIHPTHMNQIGQAAIKACREQETKDLARKLTDFADDYYPYEFMGDEDDLNAVYECNVKLLKEKDGGVTDWLVEVLNNTKENDQQKLAAKALDLLYEVNKLYGLSN